MSKLRRLLNKELEKELVKKLDFLERDFRAIKEVIKTGKYPDPVNPNRRQSDYDLSFNN
ncbi:hypothetical protein KEN51_CDS0181 [Pseudomonas phage vB_Pae10145-KEN51]|uniref:PHIKZ204.1 n=6 Tax=Viruses TaxID=10239 RepID=L7T0L6_BPDPK|nr:hypothetical protein [Pseudomonas aeruginosa]YP_009617450.1 hypothetical protein FDI90_gp162 [Pseudomonas phage PA7]YP_009619673.1 hypothetical protein FDJ06_gp133 [Pseudomonas phage SL2]YP_009639924.1 PHIKZ204.1 [Pseudomonas phage phiKZ]ANM45004.1 hypothetical protein KTN4_246 [Pseudomonas phage KTN4]QGK89876.1 hypothetical protein [Pseudomonas phage vB_PA32_GUMS]QJB22882.1 hypothetical protein fnug_239 [Pseudomonas phage fnug]QOV08094.1 hypothetical protein [Pseudomonas phage vB_PaeM_km